jgi:hypothetical protein
VRTIVPFLAASVLLPADARAQVRVQLTAPREFPESFDRVVAGAVYDNGAIVLLDVLARTVTLVDSQFRVRRPLTRAGTGPGEVQLPTGLAAGADGALVVDRALSRLVEVRAPAWRAAPFSFRDADRCAVRATQSVLLATSIDGERRVVGEIVAGNLRRAGVLTVVGWRSACDADTLAHIDIPSAKRGTSVGGLSVESSPPLPFPHSHQWIATRDGRIVIAESEGYRVRAVRGRQTLHDVRIAYSPVALSAEHQREWRKLRTSPQMSFVRDRATQTTRGEVTTEPWTAPLAWPAQLPPFLEGALVAAADGSVWIRRTTAAGARSEYDVLDSALVVRARVTLPSAQRIIAVGRRYLFAVRTDNDDVEWLERYDLPSIR